jgi:hypothetical protein
LVVRRRIEPKPDLRTRSLIDADSIDPVILRAVGNEEVGVAAVVPAQSHLRIRPNALTVEDDATTPDACGLAPECPEGTRRNSFVTAGEN